MLSLANPLTAWATVTLLNVSYDPTRELYQKINAAFAKRWKTKTGEQIMECIQQARRQSGATLVVVTHNPELAKRCDKIFDMSREGILPATRFSG